MSLLDARMSKPLEGGPTFTLSHRLFRACWGVTWWCLASWTPPPLHAWRRWLLSLFGARVHPTARVYGTAKIWYPPLLEMKAHACIGPGVICYCMAPISLGERVVVSQRAHLCAGTHDVRDPNFQLVAKPIRIGDQAWVAAEAFIGPGVSVGEGCVIGARAVLMRDAEPWMIYTGNPATPIKKRVMRADAA